MATRERIADLLWGNHGEEQARSSLRQSLAMLRKDLPMMDGQLIQTRDEFLVLQAGMIGVDALELLACTGCNDLTRLRRVALYCQGELLADLSIHDEPFEDWIRAERARLKEAAIHLLDRLSDLETGSARIAAAQQLLQLDPLRESSHRRLMRAHAENGDIGLALKQYDICRALLHDEMQAEPALETQTLRREVAQGAVKPIPEGEAERPRHRTVKLQLPDRPSIAVLPFDNASSSPDQTFFSDGISEELIANLSRFRRLFVIARASSFAFRGKPGSAKEIGQKLGVLFLLHGSVRRAGDRLRVTAELVEAESEAVLWVEKYDRPADDVFGVIDELSSTIVASIVGRLEDEVLRQARRKPTDSLAAYELVLRGRALMHNLRREDQPKARQLFEEAIRLDGNYAMARPAGLYLSLRVFLG